MYYLDIFDEDFSLPSQNDSIIDLQEDENVDKNNSNNFCGQVSNPVEIEIKPTYFISKEEEKNSQTTPILEKDEPKFYSLSEIEEKIKLSQSEFISNIKLDKNIENTIEYYFMKNKTKKFARQLNITDYFCQNSKPKKNNRGRKPKKNSKVYHGKFSPDNIIKKIKAKLFYGVILFLNMILNLKENKNLSKLDYNKYVNSINKDKDLDYLRMPLKDFICMDISPKCKTSKNNSNEEIVKNKINEKNAIINHFLEMSLSEYLDFLTNKTELKNIFTLKAINENKTIIKSIREFKGLENLIKMIMEDNDNDIKYLTGFLFYLYNYKRYFFIRKTRKNKKSK